MKLIRLFVLMPTSAVFVILLILTSAYQGLAQFSGSGAGTIADPYIITSASQLNEIRDDLAASYRLGNAIDLTSATGSVSGAFYNGGLGWDPIEAFSGGFDGQGFVIDGLFINRSSETDVGLFGSSFGGTIENVVLTNVSVTGQLNVGGLVGRAITNSTLQYIGVWGEVKSVDGIVGGIVGIMRDTDLVQSYSSGSVAGTGTASANVGGLAGALLLTGPSDLGIYNSYSVADVSGNEGVGGIGGAVNSSKITNCYHSGFITTDENNFSGIYGGNPNFTVVVNSYWNAELTCVFSGNSGSELQSQSTFQNWDFSNVWNIESGTGPFLIWQGNADDFNFIIVPLMALPDLQDVETDCQAEMPNPLPKSSSTCNVETNGVPDVSFPITAIGTTVVTWTYTDIFGNTETQTQNYTIKEDNTAPVPQQSNLPDLSDECLVDVESAPLADDACSGVIIGVSDVEFPISAQGTTVVTWTYEDDEGNVATQVQNVIIDNQTAPTPDAAILTTITEVCQVNAVSPPTATDNCGNSLIGTTATTFPVTEQGTTTIAWSFTDENGNVATQNQDLIINDEVAPIPAVTSLPTVVTNCDGTVESVSAPIANDNCGGQIVGTTNQVFPFVTTIDTQILWQYDDGNGNIEIQFQDVIVVGSDQVTVEESLCEGSDFTFPDGTIWAGELSQTSTLTNLEGCDSLVTTQISVLPSPEVDLGDDERLACFGEELTFSIDESSIDFETYTISTLFNITAQDGPLTFTFDNAFAAAVTTQEVYVTIELTDENGCVGVDQVLLLDNTLSNWGIGSVQMNDPEVVIFGTILPATADNWLWDFGDGTTNSTDVNPSHMYQANGDYIITLTVSNECGDESLSTTVAVSGVEEALGVGQFSALDFNMYPNPVTSYLIVEIDRPVELFILSIDGKRVYEKKLNTGTRTLDLSHLKSGQYFLQVLDDSGLLKNEKILKVN